MKKRALSLVLAVIMVLALAACSSGETEDYIAETAAEESASAGEAAVEAETDEPEETEETGAYYADYVYINALIYTENENLEWAEAMAVKDGVFVYVGDEDTEELNALTGEDTVVIDMNGQMITPNLIDAHTHPATVGLTAWYTEMGDVTTKEEVLSFIENYCSEHSVEEAPYIYFEYYPSELFGAEGPNKADLDAIVSDRPILVEDFSDHACWVNSKFLELIGVYDLDPEVYDLSNFIQDESGDFTGWIKEGEWKGYIENLYEAIDWYPPEECDEELMSIVTDDLKEWGVTGVFDAYIEQEEQVSTISQMDKEGKLNMYYNLSVVLGDYSELEETIETIHYFDEAYGTDRVSIDTIKIFYDGTNELGNSALIDGTILDPDDHGYLMMDLEETKDVIRRCNEEGIDVHFHLVGDLAFRQVCDAVEELQEELGEPLTSQVEMCHCELVNEADMTRPAELGIIINWTPHWSGGYFGTAAETYLGTERFNSMYQFNPMIESGAIVTFGSDIYSMAEENRANPYFGMQTAMTRIDIEYPLETGMRESEDAKLSLEDLLRGYTINAAIQLRVDDITGSIEVGKYANFNVYEQNLFEVDVEEFKDVMPTGVVFEGTVISGAVDGM